MIHITSDDGRIGSLWWINSHTTPFTLPAFEGAGRGRLIRWGATGIGRTLRLVFEEVP